MDKSPDAFRTISEAADELDLPQHVLRFWETRFATIKPLKRGGGQEVFSLDADEADRRYGNVLQYTLFAVYPPA